MFEIVITLLTALYVVTIVIFLIGIKRVKYDTLDRSEADLPLVSVVVAARNEEANLRDCLDSLVKVDYPAGKFEVVIVDDRSTDGTPDIIKEYTQRFPNLKSVVSKEESGHLQGKANALSQGIDVSTGQIIMITDADCILQPGWIKETVKYYTSSTGMVVGFTLIDAKTGFQAVQSLDWLFLLTLAVSGIRMNRPLSCVGNNMTYRREPYDQVGGYRDIKFSVTEDFSLLHAISGRTNWKVRFPVDQKALVYTKPCPTWKILYHQRKRWGTGGLQGDFFGFYIMTVAFCLHLVIVLAPFLMHSILFAIVPLLLKWAADAAVLAIPLVRFKRKRLFKYFLHFELYFILYTVLLPFIVLLGGKVVWKGRKF